MPTLTVYPDTHPESTSVQGNVAHSEKLSWANLRVADGNLANDVTGEATLDIAVIRADEISSDFDYLVRSIFLFDTLALPGGCRISSAIFSIYGNSKMNTLGLSGTDFKINIYTSAPDTNIALIAGDFNSLGGTELCDTPITYDGFALNAYNDFTLNDAGLALISKTGVTKLGIREVTFDADGATPTWAASHKVTALNARFRASPNGPKLVVTYEATFPTDDVARVSSIRHIFRPGFFRMQVGLGDLGLDIDIAETAVRAELDTAKDPSEDKVVPPTVTPPSVEEARAAYIESIRGAETDVTFKGLAERTGLTGLEIAKLGQEISDIRMGRTDLTIQESYARLAEISRILNRGSR